MTSMATGGYRKMPSNPFFKNNETRTAVMPTYGTRHIDAHPRFGFATMLNQDSPAPLPTAPAVVGGNVNWKNANVTPATQYLHSVLSGGRPMQPPPALGTTLRLTEPTVNSIHTHY